MKRLKQNKIHKRLHKKSTKITRGQLNKKDVINISKSLLKIETLHMKETENCQKYYTRKQNTTAPYLFNVLRFRAEKIEKHKYGDIRFFAEIDNARFKVMIVKNQNNDVSIDGNDDNMG
ncbi:hypothetical protein A3Q56_05143 [Intoshia linei]|uniref:Uncharacterized protein n=1 Tax=Intoshia linei TaxID=1819745 RepID=A0A177AYK8_9BILA|nr:hypothetical protein A3Q56_05143 [Intoshia linei]